jgi:pyruvate/2-oxoglutarate/acetoin dehydrogenase E1 component
MPKNIGEFTVEIGKVDKIKTGEDITIVSYGSTLKLVEKACIELERFDISCEIIDCQSLIPFDIEKDITESVKKTNRLIIIDEDFSGGASAYILDKLINEQNIYNYIDSKPQTLSAQDHRPAYGTDGDYFSKPSVDDIFNKIFSIMNELDPNKYPF